MPKLPEDFEGGAEEMFTSGDPYEDIIPLGQRKITGVKLKTGDDANEAEILRKFGYSMSIADLARSKKTLYGYIRDANLSDPLEKTALKGANALNDLMMTAPCLNRKKRYEEEEARATLWEAEMNRSVASGEDVDEDDEDAKEDAKLGEGRPKINGLLFKWSQADAFMLQAQIVEEQQGLDAGKQYYDEFKAMKVQREKAQMDAAQLLPAENMLFWCRVRQYKIMRERAYDLAMGHPEHDFTDVLRTLTGDGDVNDYTADMSWAWLEAYQLVISSVSDGETYRELFMHLNAQEAPKRPMAPMMGPWMGGYYPGMPGMNGEDGEEDDEEKKKDNRRPLINWPRGGGHPKEPPQLKRRPRGRR